MIKLYRQAQQRYKNTQTQNKIARVWGSVARPFISATIQPSYDVIIDIKSRDQTLLLL